METILHEPVSHHQYKGFHPKGVMLGGVVFLFVLTAFGCGFFVGNHLASQQYESQLAGLHIQGESQEKSYPLLKYSFSELTKRGGISSEVKIDRELEKSSEFTSYVFRFYSDGRKISGQLNIPKVSDPSTKLPVIVMARGFVAPEEYTIGQGTRNTAAALAKAGFITFAPDFLGFGESDPPPVETLAERFVKPANMLDLLASVQVLDGKQLEFQSSKLATVDAKRLGLWGHSNGGQITLSLLEISKQSLPTVLWAPVTKEFPYSILYFMDEAEDKGKGLRSLMASFEKDYDVNDFSIGNRLDDVTAKIQLHQGTADDAVPQKWSDEFYSRMVGKGKKDQIQYYVYQGADHGLTQSLPTVLERTLAFFDQEVKNKQPEPSITPTLLPSSSPTPEIIPSITPILDDPFATSEAQL